MFAALIAGTSYGERVPGLWIASAVAGGSLLVAYVRRVNEADDLDRWLLGALLLFTATALLSKEPRQSFDAVLVVATYTAAVFVGRRMFASHRARQTLVRVLRLLFVAFLVISLLRWVPAVIAWLTRVDFAVLPPLNLTLISLPWGHRYDLAIAVVMLYPAWWIGAKTVQRRMVAVALGLPVAFVVLIVGSRSVWLAVAVACLATAAQTMSRDRLRRGLRHRRVVTGVALAFAAAVVIGVMAGVFARAVNFDTVGYRTAMWGSLWHVWIAHPLVGYGPGSFPWILQLTDYFQGNTWAPRHPDSAPVQMLAEGGLVGIAAMTIVGLVILGAVFGRRSKPATLALVAFAAASLLGNPSDFPFVDAIAIGWIAYALPMAPRETPLPSRARVRYPAYACLVLIGIAYAATIVGGFAHQSAREQVAAGDLLAARTSWATAASFDPSMALYWRNEGIAAHLLEDAKAVPLLRRSVELSPTDDVSWRALGLASAAEGAVDPASASFARALELRASATNLLVTARWDERGGRSSDAEQILENAVQSWPALVGGEGWDTMLPQGVTTANVLDGALDRWAAHARTPAVESDQGVWLALLADRPVELGPAMAREGVSEVVGPATADLLQCEDARDALGAATGRDLTRVAYWYDAFWSHVQDGGPAGRDVGQIQIMTGDLNFPADPIAPLDALGESADYWGYRRLAVSWPPEGAMAGLPSPDAALMRWFLLTPQAVQTAGLTGALPSCAAR